MESLIRFFDNRFRRVDPNEFWRDQIEKERAETRRVLGVLLETISPKPIIEEETPKSEFKPIGQPNWRTRAKMLSDKSREEKLRLDQEVKIKVKENLSSPLMTEEELELELGLAEVKENV